MTATTAPGRPGRQLSAGDRRIAALMAFEGVTLAVPCGATARLG